MRNLIFLILFITSSCSSKHRIHCRDDGLTSYNSGDNNYELLIENNLFYFGPTLLENNYSKLKYLGKKIKIIDGNCKYLDGIVFPNKLNMKMNCNSFSFKFYNNRNYFSVYCNDENYCPKKTFDKEILRFFFNESGHVTKIYFDPKTSYEKYLFLHEGYGVCIRELQ